jgi:CRISPR system Cascade subunit CasE
MYLSKVIPYSKREYSREIDHRLVMRGFPFCDGSPREQFGILFRIEPDGSALVQSNVRPDWSNCLPAEHFQTREFEPPSFKVGDLLRFRLAFNSVARKQGRDRRIDPKEWLSQRNLGAELAIQSIDLKIVHESSGGHQITIHRTTCEGFCTVNDVDVLQRAIANGVGRARAYGCGLLSVRYL